jgi:hypothetical protein
MEQEQAKFEGWAIVEQMGHNKYAGFVTTQVFGAARLFRVDVPELPERQFELTLPTYSDGEYLSAGALVSKAATPAYSKLIGPSSIFAITPCTEELVRETLEHITPRPLIVLERPAASLIQAPPPMDIGLFPEGMNDDEPF